MTGKGVSWGRDSVGRSEPAFMAASTTALPPLTCTARGRRHLAAVVCCEAGQLLAVGFEACAGRRVRRLCLPAVPGSAGCVPIHSLPAMPTALNSLPPFKLLAPVHSFCFCLPPVHVHVRQDHLPRIPTVCKLQDCPVGSCNTGLQWRPVRRFHLMTYLFPAESMILGHGLVYIIKLRCTVL